jgi:hypothetical protein
MKNPTAYAERFRYDHGAYYLWVPALFWEDHADRCPSDTGDAGIAREVSTARNRVKINGTPAQLQTLYDDAVFYAGDDGPDECPANLKRSAKRCVEILDAFAEREGHS